MLKTRLDALEIGRREVKIFSLWRKQFRSIAAASDEQRNGVEDGCVILSLIAFYALPFEEVGLLIEVLTPYWCLYLS